MKLNLTDSDLVTIVDGDDDDDDDYWYQTPLQFLLYCHKSIRQFHCRLRRAYIFDDNQRKFHDLVQRMGSVVLPTFHPPANFVPSPRVDP